MNRFGSERTPLLHRGASEILAHGQASIDTALALNDVGVPPEVLVEAEHAVHQYELFSNQPEH